MFFENAAFWVFDAFDGCFESFVSLFGRFSSTMDSKMGFEKVPNSDQALNKNQLKNEQKMGPKMGSKRGSK